MQLAIRNSEESAAQAQFAILLLALDIRKGSQVGEADADTRLFHRALRRVAIKPVIMDNGIARFVKQANPVSHEAAFAAFITMEVTR